MDLKSIQMGVKYLDHCAHALYSQIFHRIISPKCYFCRTPIRCAKVNCTALLIFSKINLHCPSGKSRSPKNGNNPCTNLDQLLEDSVLDHSPLIQARGHLFQVNGCPENRANLNKDPMFYSRSSTDAQLISSGPHIHPWDSLISGAPHSRSV